MKQILLDTNVVLDFLLKRASNWKEAQAVIEEIANGRVRGYITASMATDIFYILEKTHGKVFAWNALTDILIILDVLTVYRDDDFF